MPSAANALAIANPMPEAPPVTNAVFPLSSRMKLLPDTIEFADV